MDTPDIKAEIGKVLDRLHTMRDEVRVRIHLGSMELKDAWRKLEDLLLEGEQKAKQASDAVLVDLHALGAKIEELSEKLSTSEPLGGGKGMSTGS